MPCSAVPGISQKDDPMRARILLAAAMTLVSSAAFAADRGSVSLPLGTLVTQFLSILEPLVLSLVGVMLTWLMAELGPDVAKALRSAHVDQVMSRAIDAGFGLVEGAEKGKVLEIPVANEVIRKAAQYLADQAPGLFKQIGESLGPMLVARLSAAGALPASASVTNLDLDPGVDLKKEAAAS
jgi:hypothetical protein